jgi:hypothetical protein
MILFAFLFFSFPHTFCFVWKRKKSNLNKRSGLKWSISFALPTVSVSVFPVDKPYETIFQSTKDSLQWCSWTFSMIVAQAEMQVDNIQVFFELGF